MFVILFLVTGLAVTINLDGGKNMGGLYAYIPR